MSTYVMRTGCDVYNKIMSTYVMRTGSVSGENLISAMTLVAPMLERSASSGIPSSKTSGTTKR